MSSDDCDKKRNTYRLKTPKDTDLRFFAYDVFKPSEIAFSRIINLSKRLNVFRAINPKDCIDYYYYTIRCNIVHRGKSVYSDQEIVLKSLKELLNIFMDILDETFKEYSI